jgi:hypothetical protein
VVANPGFRTTETVVCSPRIGDRYATAPPKQAWSSSIIGRGAAQPGYFTSFFVFPFTVA